MTVAVRNRRRGTVDRETGRRYPREQVVILQHPFVSSFRSLLQRSNIAKQIAWAFVKPRV